MKGYSEHRGVHSRLVYDALLDQFLQQVLTHDFATVTHANKKQSEGALIVELPKPEAGTIDKSSSRRSRMTVMPSVQKKRTG